MKRSFSLLGISILSTIVSPALLAATLNAMDVASLPGDRVELKLTFDEPVSAPRGYSIEQPARIALDLPGVTSKLGTKNRELGMGNARSVTVVEAKDRTRLIVNLASLAPYTTRVEGSTLYVVVGGPGKGGSSVAPSQTATVSTPPAVARPAPVAKPYVATSKSIRNIDFQRGEQGEGNVVIELSDSVIAPDIQEQGGKIRLDFGKVELPESLRVKLDVKDFATPVQFVNAGNEGGRSILTIEPTGYYDYLAFQTENKLTLSVKPLAKEDVEKQRAERFAYNGEKLSLNFQDIDVRSVLQLIADFTDLNLVASDSVNGNITLRLQNVPWDQALDLVLKTKGLDKRKVGNVLLVAPADEIAARERQELESSKQLQELAPLRRQIIRVSYAKASDIAKLFETKEGGAAVSADKANNSPSWGLGRGSIIYDDRSNNLIVYETQEKLDEIARIIAQLDIPVRQVMIEARVVEANVDYDKSLGVRWGGALKGGNWRGFGKDGNIGIKEQPGQGQGQGQGQNIPRPSTCGPFFGDCTLPVNGNKSPMPFVDMGVINSTSGLGIGFITNNVILDLQLSAMEKSGNGEIVSQPKVVTSDKQTAKILKGAEIPYQESSSSGATSTSFKEAALSLEVTPQITPDNRVIMEVKVTKDAPDFANALNGVPPINKNEVNASVLVADGETIVIGGVFSNQQTSSVEKVPFLGDLPFVGRLFKRDMVEERKAELLVFLTPRIMNNQAIAVGR